MIMEYNFKVREVTESLINWIKVWFEHNGKNCNAVIGISGGKDSTIVGKLLVEALGKDRVIGVLLPNGEQHDKDVAERVCSYLGIKSYTWNIGGIFDQFMATFRVSIGVRPSEQSQINLAPRLRMAALRMVAQSFNGRFVNTSNLSEDWVGYATVDGDAAGDMSPLSMLTVQEVKAIGHHLGIPRHFVEKIPEDGLVGKSDEDNLGVSYLAIDRYIRGYDNDLLAPEEVQIIEKKFAANKFKLTGTSGMPKFVPLPEDLYDNVDKDWIKSFKCYGEDPRMKNY